MRLGGNKNAREFFRKHGMTDMHSKIEKKYTSKAAQAYKAELAKLVNGEAAKRGEGAISDGADSSSDLLANLELADKEAQDGEARAKLAEARVAAAQPAQAKAQLASTMPGAKRLVVTPPSSGNAPKFVLRKPAGNAGSSFNMMKKKPAGAANKLKANRLNVTPTKEETANNHADEFNNFEDPQKIDKSASAPVPPIAPLQVVQPTTNGSSNGAKSATDQPQVAKPAETKPQAFAMKDGVDKLKMMNSDFFSGF